MTTEQEGSPMALANERVAWFNGKIVRESEVLIPFRDQGFLRGDAVFDMTRSFNGKAKIVRESEVLIPFRDQGFLRGDAVFDMTRSFNGKAFRLAEHIARLYRSLR